MSSKHSKSQERTHERIRRLLKVKENWPEIEIRAAVKLIEGARRIFVAGFGVSRSVVEFIDFGFNRLGYPVTAITCGGAEIIEKFSGATSSDVIITVGFGIRRLKEQIRTVIRTHEEVVGREREFWGVSQNATIHFCR